MNVSKIKVAVVLALGVTTLSGCMGQMGASQMVTKGNLSAVDNRYGRAGLFVLLSPVYGVASLADLFIFNSIEFWTGENPITGKGPAVVDQPVEAIFKVNDKLDKSLTEVPLQANNKSIEKAVFKQVDAQTLEMFVAYADGRSEVLRGEKMGENVNFYLNEEFITTASLIELESYIGANNI